MLLISGRIAQLITLLLIFGLIIFFVERGRRGKVPWIRRLAGLDAIEEAVGRATEMGRPVHFTTGFGHYGLTNPTYAPMHLAGLTVLGYVSRLAAKRRTKLITTIADPTMIPLYEDIMKQAYLAEGVSDQFSPDSARFLSSYQFAYAVGVMDILRKEKVASNLMIGTFLAEALLFSETGAAAGCVQVAGTANISQLPFFAGICDYTLIGEDIYAAGAYVSKDHVLLGSIAGQDLGKVAAVILIIVLTALVTLNVEALTRLLKM